MEWWARARCEVVGKVGQGGVVGKGEGKVRVRGGGQGGVVSKGEVRGGWQGGPGWARTRCEVVGKVGQGGVVSKGGVVGKVGRL